MRSEHPSSSCPPSRSSPSWADSGVRDFLPAQFGSIKSRGLITDDTQMTLFTVDGIIRAISRERTKGLGFTAGVLHHAYLRWLDTQQAP